MKNHLNTCPKCGSNLKISRYLCHLCGTTIDGDFQGCQFCQLDDEDRLFALVFLQTEGNMKDVERLMGISYPTIKSKLKNINSRIGSDQSLISLEFGREGEGKPVSHDRPQNLSGDEKTEILNRLAAGRISASEASALLRGKIVNDDGSQDH